MEDVLRPLGFVGIVFGFLLIALGIAQSFHTIPPTQFSDRLLESTGAVLIVIGIALTEIARRSGESATVSAVSTIPGTDANKPLSITMTKTTRTIGVDPAGMTPTALSHLVDASSKALLTGMLADLNDPSKASTIHIEGGDIEQVKEKLRTLLSPATAAEVTDATAASNPNPDAPLDASAAQLRELDDLHAAGVLSDEQYQAARAKLLG